MPVYIELFHGRHSPDEELNDWGFHGPIIGPVPYCHITYGSHIKVGEEHPIDELCIDKDGYVEFEGAFYGDFSIFDQITLNQSPDLKKRFERTQKVLSSTKDDWPLMVTDKDEEEWVKLLAERKLKDTSTLKQLVTRLEDRHAGTRTHRNKVRHKTPSPGKHPSPDGTKGRPSRSRRKSS